MSAGFLRGRGVGRRIGPAVAAALALTLVGTSCQSDQTPPPWLRPLGSTPTPTPTRTPTPSIGPVRLGAKPLWSVPRAGQRYEVSLLGFRIVGDTLAYFAMSGGTVEHLVIADVATGRVRRTIDKDGDLGGGVRATWFGLPMNGPQIASIEDETVVLFPYARDDEKGIAGVSGKDGDVLWTIPCGQTSGFAAYGRTMFVQTSDGLRAYDLSRRRLLWQKPGNFLRLLGRAALVQSPKGIVAYDRDSGDQLWDHSAGGVTFEGSTATMLAIAQADELLVLDARTGDELTRLPGRQEEVCAIPLDPLGSPSNAGADFLTCDDPGHESPRRLRFITRAGDGVKVLSVVESSGRAPFQAYTYRVWNGELVELLGRVALDSSGGEVPIRLPAGCTMLVASSDRYAVFLDGARGQAAGFQVHALRR